jgi:DNA (cytosine-5)-methyltransferase 1
MKFVDLFAGWGGFTEGATAAGGRLVCAANHWPLAVEAHAQNHPEGDHWCQDLRQADFSLLPAYDVLLASPACQGHSQAAQPARKRNGGVRQTHDAYRATAWAVVDCVEVTRPRAVLVENVADFTRWQHYDLWLECFRRMGYRLTAKVLRASRMGVPQRRDRLFIAAALDREVSLDFAREDEPGFGPCIDWDAGTNWRPVREGTVKVRERIANARRRLGAKRFLTQHVTNHPGVGLDEPIRTITTKDQWAVVDGDLYRPLTVRENARAMGFPDSYGWPRRAKRKELIRGLGNAVCPPVAERLFTRVADTLSLAPAA